MAAFKMMSLSLLAGFFLCFSLGGCGEEREGQKEETTLVMITSGDNPPFEFHDTSTGKDELKGADIELAHALCKELGVNLEIKDVDFNSIIPALQAQRADFAMALITPTEERKKNISFSDIYFIARIAVVTLKNKTITSERELEGKKIGVQLASTNEQAARKLEKTIKNLEIVSFNKLGELIQEVRTERIDGVLVEELIAKAYAEANEDLDYNNLEEYQSSFAIAFPKDSPWVDKFNLALKQLKARGALDEIIKKWLK
jgi:ABC-type amino acid transport substrate-binding protein